MAYTTSDLENQVLHHLHQQTRPISSLQLARLIYGPSAIKGQVNPTLYRLHSEGRVAMIGEAQGSKLWATPPKGVTQPSVEERSALLQPNLVPYQAPVANQPPTIHLNLRQGPDPKTLKQSPAVIQGPGVTLSPLPASIPPQAKEQILAYLWLAQRPVPTLELARHVFGPQAVTSHINKDLYALASKGLIQRSEGWAKPHWCLPGQLASLGPTPTGDAALDPTPRGATAPGEAPSD